MGKERRERYQEFVTFGVTVDGCLYLSLSNNYPLVLQIVTIFESESN